MYSVLIADDDVNVRMDLKALIPWNQYGFLLLEDAVDGKDAMHKILRTYAGKVFVIYFDISEDECRKRCLERGEEPSIVEEKIINDRNRLKNFDTRLANMIIRDKDLGRFKEILKENASKWVIR